MAKMGNILQSFMASYGSTIGMKYLSCLDAEKAHHLALSFLSLQKKRHRTLCHDPILAQEIGGLSFPNPVGLAAGLDKNAVAMPALLDMGFGAIEVGAITPKPQGGNPKPRLFRLKEDRAIINRMGFNNDGLDVILGRVQERKFSGIVGVNLGKNKDGDAVEDYRLLLRSFYGVADYMVMNISSPNTPGLRDQQTKSYISDFLSGVLEGYPYGMTLHSESNLHERGACPLFLKISPDMKEEDLDYLLEQVVKHPIDGLIVSNTTLSRDGLISGHARENGGLSGRPLFRPSTDVLRYIYSKTEGKIPLIGVGGIEDGASAYQKIRAGASFVQLYTALVYKGPSCVSDILKDLKVCLARDGFDNVSQAVGVDCR